MSYFADSRQPQGPGILILQHENYDKQYTLDMRPSILAVRIDARLDRGDFLGHYKYRKENVGDIICATLWPKGDGKKAREMSGWSWAWPAVLSAKKDEDEPDPPWNGQWCSPLEEEEEGKKRILAYPLRYDEKSKKLQPDFRFKGIAPAILGGKKPAGTQGILLSTTNEEKQYEVFFPVGGEEEAVLHAVNEAGDPHMGSIVADTTYNWKQGLKSRLQSVFWIVNIPGQLDAAGFPPFIPPGGLDGQIAWNWGREGCWGTYEDSYHGGFVLDSLGGNKQGIGAISSTYAGALTVGPLRDKHKIAESSSARFGSRPIQPVHISANAYYWKQGKESLPQACLGVDPGGTDPMDGPFDFEGMLPEEIQNCIDAEYPINVHLEYWPKYPDFYPAGSSSPETFDICIYHDFGGVEQRIGKWKWRASCHWTETDEEGESEEEGGGGKSGGGGGGESGGGGEYKWGDACPRIDAWVEGEGWIYVGRAIRFCENKDGKHTIVLCRSLKKFRVVEDEGEISVIKDIRSPAGSWGLGEVTLRPGDIAEFLFDYPVSRLETIGHYRRIKGRAHRDCDR